MPAVSKKQRKAMAIAEHAPESLYKRNKGLAKMDKGTLSEFAATKEKGLPEKKSKGRESIEEFMKRRNSKGAK